ncbi:hypothetical protein BYT27DRAFT_7208949 [Phlegmacium glaucopus]|nr:hypothetical protein BYT27DRAFT_7208949 [Phlegmacium glaucopus]
MLPPVEQVTAQGYDLQFGTNVLGHSYFTKLLLPTLLAAAKISPDGKARIVNTSLLGHSLPAVSISTLSRKDQQGRRKELTNCIPKANLGNIHVSNEFSKRYGEQGIVSTSLNPGNIKTDLQRHVSPSRYFVKAALIRPVSYGALTPLWAGTSPEGTGLNGKYLIPWARVGQPTSIASDLKLSAELWTWRNK